MSKISTYQILKSEGVYDKEQREPGLLNKIWITTFKMAASQTAMVTRILLKVNYAFCVGRLDFLFNRILFL